jgi:hypothetical protein
MRGTRHFASAVGLLVSCSVLAAGCTSSGHAPPRPSGVPDCSQLANRPVSVGFRCVVQMGGRFVRWTSACFPADSIGKGQEWWIPLGDVKILMGNPQGGRWALAPASISVPNMTGPISC